MTAHNPEGSQHNHLAKRNGMAILKQIKLLVPVLLLIAVSAVSVFYQFNEMPPPYPWTDEAGVGYEANLTLTAGPRMIDPSPPGAVHDPHYAVTVVTVFLAAAVFRFFGPSLAALRLISGFMGIVSVVAVYFLAKEMFREDMRDHAHYIGLTSGGLMAGSLWFLGTTRIGWAPPAALMLGTVFLYFLWKAINTRRVQDYVVAGLFLALAQYGHITARFLPFALGAFLALNLLSNLITRRMPDSLIWHQRRGWVVLGGVSLIGILPIIQYYLRFPEDLFHRARYYAPVFSARWSFTGQVSETLDGLLGVFQTLGLDLAWLTSRDGYVLLSPLVVILIWGGLALSLLRVSRHQYQFILASWIILFAPAWLTDTSNLPFLKTSDYARRGILAMSITFIIGGLFLVEASWRLQKWGRRVLAVRAPMITYGLVVILSVIVVVWAGWHDYHVYFVEWISDPHIQTAFSSHFVPTVQRLQEISQPESVLIFPISAFKDTTERPDLYNIGFLYQGDAPFAVMTNDQKSLPHTLTNITRGRSVVHLLQPSSDHDPQHAIPWMLSTYGKPHHSAPKVPGYDVHTFHLNPKMQDFTQLPEPLAAEIPFGHHMELKTYRYGSNLMGQGFVTQKVESSGTLLIDLSWKLLNEGVSDYYVAAILRDASEQTITQSDTRLVDAAGFASSLWQVDTVEHVYLSLPVPVGLAPGKYWLDVTLYDAATLRRQSPLHGRGDLSYRLGPVTVLPAVDLTVSVDALEPSVRKSLQITPALQMVGLSLESEKPLLTGDSLQGIIYWQASAPIAGQVAADYALVAPDGSVIPLARSVLLGGISYPTQLWRPSEMVADYLSLRIPPDVTGGAYRFGARLANGRGESLAEVPLAEVTVKSWNRIFDLPTDVSPLAWTLGDSIRLVGIRLPQTVHRAESLPIHLFWQTENDVDSPYIAFVHVLDETGNLVWQDDSVPGQGERPVPGWQVGEIVEDRRELAIPSGVTPGTYQVVVGLYHEFSGDRLPVVDPVEGDTVFVGYVMVE